MRRLGIIGAGAVAGDHLAAIGRVPGLTVVHVMDRHLERAQALAALAGRASFSTDLESLWSADLDAVLICTSPESHADFAVEAFRTGVGVMLEKPAALTVADLDRVLEAAAASGKPLLVGQTARFQPAHMEMCETLRSGALGEPRLVHLTWYAGHVWPGAWRAWQLDVDRCGGHIVHNGIHALDLLIWLLQDEPLRIFAREIPTWSSVMPTTDSFHMLVEFARGALATIEVSYAFAGGAPPLRRIVVAGTGGIASIDSEIEPRGTSGSGASFPIRSAVDGLVHQFEHLQDILANDVAPITTPDQVRSALAAAFAARQSAATGQPVRLGGTL